MTSLFVFLLPVLALALLIGAATARWVLRPKAPEQWKAEDS